MLSACLFTEAYLESLKKALKRAVQLERTLSCYASSLQLSNSRKQHLIHVLWALLVPAFRELHVTVAVACLTSGPAVLQDSAHATAHESSSPAEHCLLPGTASAHVRFLPVR